jgi:hypothetical protein
MGFNYCSCWGFPTLNQPTTSGVSGANVITNANVVHNVTYIATNTAFNQNFSTTATDIKMNGTQSLGSLVILSRAKHVHPSDTTKSDKILQYWQYLTCLRVAISG